MAAISDVEDGEILSGDDETEVKQTENKMGNPFGNYKKVDRTNLAHSMATDSKQFRQVRAADIHYSSDEDRSAPSDSDEDSSPLKKKPMKNKPIMRPSGTSYVQDTQWLKNTHKDIVSNRGNKKPNNIWGSVLQEESMAKFVNKLNRNEEVDYSSTTGRGAESYDWTRSKLDNRFGKDYGDSDEVSNSSDPESSEEEEEKEVTAPDLTEIETFAAAIERPKLSIKKRLGRRKSNKKRHSTDSNKSNKSSVDLEDSNDNESGDDLEDDNTMDGRVRDAREKIKGNGKKSRVSEMDIERTSDKIHDARDLLKKNRGKFDHNKPLDKHSRSSSKQTDARDFLNRKRTNDQRKSKPWGRQRFTDLSHMDVEIKPMKLGKELNSSMDTMLLADTMVDGLQEPPDKLETIISVIETVGVEKAIKLYKATEDVEEMGGLMIQNGLRRRTPGGVFFFLIREDCNITQEQKSTIFAASSKEYKEQCKAANRERKKAARARKRAENARKKREMETSSMDIGSKQNGEQTKVETEETVMKDDGNDESLDLGDHGVDIEIS